MQSRLDRNPLADWWWTVDRLMFVLIILLMVTGIVLGLAGSPPVAERLGLPTFHFVIRQAINLAPAFVVMMIASFMTPRLVRRTALALYLVGMALVIATLLFGTEVKGAKRWINLMGIALQPSEFVKPAFIILVAWAFSEGGVAKMYREIF